MEYFSGWETITERPAIDTFGGHTIPPARRGIGAVHAVRLDQADLGVAVCGAALRIVDTAAAFAHGCPQCEQRIAERTAR